jgi:hypothetical protein
MSVARGAAWLVTPVGADEQFTGADFNETDVLYAKTAEDFVRGEVLPRLDAIERRRRASCPRC